MFEALFDPHIQSIVLGKKFDGEVFKLEKKV
jgi:hypothetical protein